MIREKEIKMDEDQFNINVRKYLKKVGITSQRKIENAVREALDAGSLNGDENLDVKVTLSSSSLKLRVEINDEISLA